MDATERVPEDGDDTWEGPWILELGRRLTPSEARRFSRRASLGPTEAACWVAAGLGPFDAMRAREAGHGIVEVLRRHQEADWPGFSRAATQWWRTVVGDDMSGAIAWRDAGFGLSAADWLAYGISVPQDARLLRDAGVENVREWTQAGFTPSEIVKWQSLSSDGVVSVFSPAEALAWVSCGFAPDEAKSWGSFSETPEQAATLRDEGHTAQNMLAAMADDRVIIGELSEDLLLLSKRDGTFDLPEELEEFILGDDVYVDMLAAWGFRYLHRMDIAEAARLLRTNGYAFIVREAEP